MRILVVGDGPVADVLAPMIDLLGFSLDRALDHTAASAVLPHADAIIVTSHHGDVDGPVLRDALATGTAYVGAMGSRKTQDRRRAWLTEAGVSDADQARIHGPAGLDIGADGPGEIALSILAELVAVHRGAQGAGSISGREGPIHPAADGEAYCPGG